MRAVVQRVLHSSVTVDGAVVGRIAQGLTVLVGVSRDDVDADADQLADKVVTLRIFEDDAHKMNRSLVDVAGGLLAVSQFTLLADTRRGKRPSFGEAMEPVRASALFQRFCDRARRAGVAVETGVFGADMLVEIANDGPVTIWLDTRATNA